MLELNELATERSTLLDDTLLWQSLFFFFSSRRRHTRFDCDWSSDVCSSDLLGSVCIEFLVPSRRISTAFEMSVSKRDRKSTRLNSSHSQISYAVFCLKKKNGAVE